VSAVKDLRRLLRDPAALLVWLAIPLAVGALMMLAFGGSEPTTIEAQLLVADHDRTMASRLFVDGLDRLPVVAADTMDEARGRTRVAAGKASALLVIPQGLQSALLRGQPMELPLLVNPAERVLPGIIEESADALLDGASYAQRLLREPLGEVGAALDSGASWASEANVARLSARMSRSAVRLRPYFDPPLVALETRVEEGEGAVSFGALFIPGLLLMTLLFVGEGLSGDVWRERSQGTLRRVVASPRPARAFLGGKLLAGAIVIAAICAVALPAHAAFFGIGFGRVPLALAWAVFTGTVFLAALMLIQLLASQQRTAGVLTSMILFPLLMVGGSFFPFETMPAWLARIGRATPNGWALTQLEAILGGAARAADLIVPFAVLSVIGVACFLMAARRVARGFANS